MNPVLLFKYLDCKNFSVNTLVFINNTIANDYNNELYLYEVDAELIQTHLCYNNDLTQKFLTCLINSDINLWKSDYFHYCDLYKRIEPINNCDVFEYTCDTILKYDLSLQDLRNYLSALTLI